MQWLERLGERLLGYADAGGGWRLYPIDATHRRRFSLPERVPVPGEVWRLWPAGERPERLSHAELAEFAARFLHERPQHWAALAMRRFASKAPLAARVEESLRRADWDEAALLLEEILALDAADGRAHFLLGLCRLGTGRIEEAGAALSAAAPQMEIDADYLVACGRVAEQHEDLEGAREQYHAALAIQKEHPTALERLAALGELVEIYLGDLDAPEKAYLTREDYADFIEKGWDAESHDAPFFLERSRFHLLSGQPELAWRASQRAAAESKDAAEETAILEAECRALLALERFAEVEERVLRIESLVPKSPAALALRGQLLWFRGQRDAAAAVIRRALAADPNRPENVRLYLDPQFPRRTRDLRSAIQQLLKKYPQSWAVQWIAASIDLASGNWTEGTAAAIAAAAGGASEEALIELSGRLGRAERFRDIGRLAEAAGGWQRFRMAHPLLRSNLATALERTGDAPAARALWQSLLEDASAHPELRLRARHALRGAREGTPAGSAR